MTGPAEDEGPATLVELLAERATNSRDIAAYTFGDESRTFGRLWADVEAFAALLVERGLEPGGRVVIALPNGHGFFTAFYGTQAAGAVAVPIYPGVPPQRVIDVARMCGSQHVVRPAGAAARVEARWRAGAGDLCVLTPLDRPGRAVELPAVLAEDVAFIQYTSGSTGDPKGVLLTHRDLLTNVRQMIAGMEITAKDRFVSWLPVYHDMGLILMSIVPFYLAAPLFLLPTSLRDIRPWLEALTQHRGTFTASPDFGYRMLLRQLARSEAGAQRWDLSSVRVALNAAEFVRASTMDAFHEAFGLEDVMVAGYGLAEATVGVSMWKPSTPNRVDARGVVSVGRPFPGVTVQILGDDDQPLPPGQPGHITIRSPATTSGYFANPSATAALFVDPETIRTGDIGYLDADGFLYILSRAKEVIIHAGRSVYPQEIEEVVSSVDGVRYAAAIGIDHGRVEGEQVTVLAEIQPDTVAEDETRKSCVIAITTAIHQRFGFHPGRVHLVAPKSLPRTHNGKLQRGVLRQRYLDGVLREQFLYPVGPPT